MTAKAFATEMIKKENPYQKKHLITNLRINVFDGEYLVKSTF